MKRPLLIPIFLFISIIVSVYAYSATPTGYYLPEGYKVTAKVYVPDAPFWPGETLGDIFGIASQEYSVLAVGYGGKGGPLEGFAVEKGIKVVWIQGGRQEVKAKISIQNTGEHDVTILYGYDGQIKISVNGEFIFSFVATEKKYQIVSQGAAVNSPELIPKQQPDETSDDNNSNDTGEGYNIPSVSEIQTQYLLLGAGIVLAVSLVFILSRRR